MYLNRIALAVFLTEKRISKVKLAELAGISRITISAVCNGKSCRPETAEKIAAALGVPLDSIKGG